MCTVLGFNIGPPASCGRWGQAAEEDKEKVSDDVAEGREGDVKYIYDDVRG